jgi:hypothetical protein
VGSSCDGHSRAVHPMFRSHVQRGIVVLCSYGEPFSEVHGLEPKEKREVFSNPREENDPDCPRVEKGEDNQEGLCDELEGTHGRSEGLSTVPCDFPFSSYTTIPTR